MTLAAVGHAPAAAPRAGDRALSGSKGKLVEALVDRITTVWNARNVEPHTVGKSGLDGLLLNLDAIRAMEREPRRAADALRPPVRSARSGPGTPRPVELDQNDAGRHGELRTPGLARRVRRRRHQPKAKGAAVVGALRGIGYQWLLDPDDIDPSALLRHLVRSTDRRFAPRWRRRSRDPSAPVRGPRGRRRRRRRGVGTAITERLSAGDAQVVVADLDSMPPAGSGGSVRQPGGAVPARRHERNVGRRNDEFSPKMRARRPRQQRRAEPTASRHSTSSRGDRPRVQRGRSAVLEASDHPPARRRAGDAPSAPSRTGPGNAVYDRVQGGGHHPYPQPRPPSA